MNDNSMETEMETEQVMREDLYNALNEIKDRAVMLAMASEYICEDVFLKSIGSIIKEKVDVLKSHVENLEGQSVGKPVDELKLNEKLEGIAHFAELLEEPAKDLNDKCVKGELGRELGEKVISLANGVSILQGRVDGRSLSYSRSDSVKGILDRLGFAFAPVTALSRVFLKILLILAFFCIVALGYLFFTMETEKGILEEIEQNRSSIKESEAVLLPTREELKQIREQISNIRQKELDRDGEIEVMDLNVKAFELAERQEKAEAKIKLQQKMLEDNIKKLEEMKQKSFLKQLLRR
jgi:hypothetical protein